MSEIRFATKSVHVHYDGREVHVKKGEAWNADDPFVKAHGHLFAEAPKVRATEAPVERATRAPGERRGAVRKPEGRR